ncbi:dual specificity protein kinase splA isoform X2 [Scaptodrosophila lebanonensis]|uniref:Dual specificity protein kinase splA isoform X2 n=1 Tax=Drosophila lebanonensis TaxID=7225 RepID=A0A6J2TIE1_DROLE|nr:dual specificity protein kinase splA isoform X2 [Scaptodrosophila lebanonensis]
MPNKTDEEKKKLQQKGEEEAEKEKEEPQQQHAAEQTNATAMEPIYENISSTISMHEVDNEQPPAMIANRRRRSIPNKNNNNSNSNNNNNDMHNQIINQTNSNNNCNNQTDKHVVTITTTTTALSAASTATTTTTGNDAEPYYQVPKALEPYYDAPKHLRPIPVYENIEIFYTGLDAAQLANGHNGITTNGSSISNAMEPPKEKPPPPPTESPPPVPPATAEDELDGGGNMDTWSSDNTYETIAGSTRRQQLSEVPPQPSPPIKRMNSTKRIKKELRNKRSSFLGIETGGDLDDVESYLELTVAPPPDMAQLLQEERRLEKQLYIKAGLCDSSDTGESRDSGVSENHSRQSSEHYTNSSEENDTHSDTPPPPPHSLKPSNKEVIYQNEQALLSVATAAQTPLLQTVKGNSAESWTESATAAAAATQSLTEATATANAKMLSIEEKIREQGEVLRVERELLHFSQEELKRQRENLLLRENLARRELQHGAKMLMSNNRRSLQDLHNGIIGNGMLSAFQPPQAVLLQYQQQQQQQIYANVAHLQQHQQQQYYQHVESDYRKSMSDLNEFSKRLMLPPPTPPTKPLRAMHIATNGNGGVGILEPDYASARQRHSLTAAQSNVAATAVYGGSLVKIAGAPLAATPRAPANNYIYHHQSAQNLSQLSAAAPTAAPREGNMSRNTLHALSATPKPKYTDGWVQVQQRKNFDTNLANDPAWLSAYQQKRKSMPDYNGQAYNNAGSNHWLVQEAEQRRLLEQQQQQQQQQHSRRSMPTTNGKSNGKPLPDSIIQTLTERVQSKGIGERKRFENGNYSQVINGNGFAQHSQSQQSLKSSNSNNINSNANTNGSQEKVLSVSGKKKCSHCGDELAGRGAAMIIESLLLFYHINCFKCCVCHVQLGDGLNGTDVRVRNHKLHCQNCYSSDDGIKFSCV